MIVSMNTLMVLRALLEKNTRPKNIGPEIKRMTDDAIGMSLRIVLEELRELQRKGFIVFYHRVPNKKDRHKGQIRYAQITREGRDAYQKTIEFLTIP